jgi:hypothetical protein
MAGARCIRERGGAKPRSRGRQALRALARVVVMTGTNPQVMTDAALALAADRASRACAELREIAKAALGPETRRAAETAATFAQSAELWSTLARELARVKL